MIRFFTNKYEISNKKITLTTQDASHIRSLRLRPDEYFIVCDCEGTDYICRLADSVEVESKTKEKFAVAEIMRMQPSIGEPDFKCSVFIAYAKGDRLDYAVQKSVELGAYEIIIFPSQRCVSTPGDKGEKKIARLQKIALETAKQCDRGLVPEVVAVESFKQAVGLAIRSGVAIFPYECEDKLSLKQALEQNIRKQSSAENPEEADVIGYRSKVNSISIMTGPEGGFTSQEADYAKSEGMLTVTLGPRILRCETAPVAVLAAIMYHTGNLS